MKKLFTALPPLLVICLLSLGTPAFAAKWTDYSLVAHALGGIDQKAYTNSYEAFETNYEKGQRIFEIDLQFTSDGYLIGRHDWSAYAFQSLGQALTPAITGGPLPLADMKTMKMFDKYNALEFSEIIDLMHEYPDAYFVTDTKSTDKDMITAQFSQIVELANEDPYMLERIIPQIYNESMYPVIEKVFPFESYIYTLYQTTDSNQKVLQFVKNHKKITAVTMPEWRATAGFVGSLKKINKLAFVHTINSPEEMAKYKARGVYGFYTDFVTPEDLKVYYAKKAQETAAKSAKASSAKTAKKA
ncbi:phosphatidylinositol-specific phospholipase C/glycerophosphodiester phosphodiesterase family protein [Paenibacillus dokdonensis]|uniref:Phosphatidylinositol-specific phospholipase C/glycerophosphodiester phosphodiesterase family protein n=1 Tax=Paenibacillus dokdonensis TaxID=2567944 RepID=A0ABU6GHY8_9BACL|nr:phosphatidylinositol-specific phospholipase C/glycerophosphodiester phosphodiesterase family protein [Paenibacillus dokdonensis]MEC0239346.1 phosphatidylinositol-specific phospholipase C/glycerophosphodiester phosphodiesterase family protein [Paenibacillus dokdonensis]